MGTLADAKKLGRFYTPEWAARALVERVRATPTTALDLCCGGGALAAAAAARWTLSELVTVDLDQAITGDAFRGLAAYTRHIQGDALTSAFRARLAGQTFDLVLCNPPFGRRRRKDATALDGPTVSRQPEAYVTAEVIALRQALELARPGGVVAMIVPDTLATGQILRSFRAQLIAEHELLSVTELPAGAFTNTEAKAYLMVIRVQGKSDRVLVERLGPGGMREGAAFVEAGRCIDRMDLAKTTELPVAASHRPLGTLGASVSRGRLSATMARSAASPFFHTTHFAASEAGIVRLSNEASEAKEASGAVIARVGDILVARVDRRLEEKVAIVGAGTAEITDCVYRIRSAPAHRARIWAALRSPDGRARLASSARGVGAKHLPLSELLALPV